jgi:hypothetical protein
LKVNDFRKSAGKVQETQAASANLLWREFPDTEIGSIVRSAIPRIITLREISSVAHWVPPC